MECRRPNLRFETLITMTLHDFDAIRPYAPDEIPQAVEALMDDAQFRAILPMFFPGADIDQLKEQMKRCPDSLTFQKQFLYPVITVLLAKCIDGFTLRAADIPVEERTEPHTYISNHRDIVLDSAILDVLLIDNGFGNTVEIAIGDNLLIYPWIRILVQLNKAFIVQRSVGLREMLASSKRMSEYMHFAVAEKKENIWIAQREGRAKDSNDRTQESLLKMMAMGGEGTPLERIRQLNLVPLAISYEYDPCDYLKAQEFQQKRDNADFKKSKQDDLVNMKTGIMGYKGKVVYGMSAPVNTWLDELAECSKTEFFARLAQRIDQGIHKAYVMFPNNYVAYDLLKGGDEMAARYTAEEKQRFESYLQQQIALVDLPQKDEAFLRERILTMYANPLINHLAATAQK